MANRINWFEIPVLDLERAARFYGNVISCAVHVDTDEGMAVLDYEAGEVSGCLVRCEQHQPSRDGVLIYLNAEGRLEQAVAEARRHGGAVLQEAAEIGPYGFRALILDTEGNRVALHSYRA